MELNLKEFHDVLLELLVEFDRVCQKHNIKYSLSFGTLLGAIRHKGFIPWDDDVDIMMTRENYDKMCRIFPKEVKSEYFFQSKETDKRYPYNICRLRKNNSAMIYEHWEKSGIHQGIYIDICPCDEISDSKIKRMLQKWIIIFMTPIRISRNKVIFLGSNQMSHNKCKTILYSITKIFPKRLCDKLEYKAITCANNKNNKKTGIICEGGILYNTPKDMFPFKSKYLTSYEMTDFEGHKFMISSYYKELLTGWYGDYMQLPPENERVMFHQPKYYSTNSSYKKYLKKHVS